MIQRQIYTLYIRTTPATRLAAQQLRPSGKPRIGWGKQLCGMWIARMETVEALQRFRPWREMRKDPGTYLSRGWATPTSPLRRRTPAHPGREGTPSRRA